MLNLVIGAFLFAPANTRWMVWFSLIFVFITTTTWFAFTSLFHLGASTSFTTIYRKQRKSPVPLLYKIVERLHASFYQSFIWWVTINAFPNVTTPLVLYTKKQIDRIISSFSCHINFRKTFNLLRYQGRSQRRSNPPSFKNALFLFLYRSSFIFIIYAISIIK